MQGFPHTGELLSLKDQFFHRGLENTSGLYYVIFLICINILPQSDQENVLPLTGTAFKPKPLLHQLLFIHDMI